MVHEKEYKSHDEWLEMRNHSIGGSDASSVIGMNPYKSAYTLWAEKTGKVPPFEGNLITEVGAYLEQFVADLFEKETGKKVHKKNRTLFNDLYPFAHANIDRAVIGERAFLEIKTTNSVPLMKKLRSNDDFPDAYLAQCVHYMAVGNFEKCYLAVLINCQDFKIYEMGRDQDEINALMLAEGRFWECVKTGTPPEADGSFSTTESVNSIYPESEDETVDISAFESFLRRRSELDFMIRDLDSQKSEIDNRIKAYMRESAYGESDNYQISWKSSVRHTINTEALKKDHPEIVKKYTTETPSRTFRVTEKTQKNGT